MDGARSGEGRPGREQGRGWGQGLGSSPCKESPRSPGAEVCSGDAGSGTCWCAPGPFPWHSLNSEPEGLRKQVCRIPRACYEEQGWVREKAGSEQRGKNSWRQEDCRGGSDFKPQGAPWPLRDSRGPGGEDRCSGPRLRVCATPGSPLHSTAPNTAPPGGGGQPRHTRDLSDPRPHSKATAVSGAVSGAGTGLGTAKKELEPDPLCRKCDLMLGEAHAIAARRHPVPRGVCPAPGTTPYLWCTPPRPGAGPSL